MSQPATWGVPLVGPVTPAAYATRADDSLDALLSQHSGASRPAYAVAHTLWAKTISAGLAELYWYDGADDILVGKAHMGANVFGGASKHFPFDRPKYRWKDADEVYIGPGGYRHVGTVDQYVYWDAELTFAFGSGGSNAASVDLANNDFYYLYLDDSAIVTAATPVITAAQLVANITAPTWSDAKKGWYSGTDRCIGAFLTGGTANILEFFHDGGDYFHWAANIEEAGGITPNTTWTDVDCATSVPAFSQKAKATFYIQYTGGSAAAASLVARVNGQADGTGHLIGYVSSDATATVSATDVPLDSSQILEVKWAATAATNTVFVYVNGWFFPAGM